MDYEEAVMRNSRSYGGTWSVGLFETIMVSAGEA